jgi:hypothetical protein
MSTCVENPLGRGCRIFDLLSQVCVRSGRFLPTRVVPLSSEGCDPCLEWFCCHVAVRAFE